MRNNTPSSLDAFKTLIWDFYHKNKRQFAWRDTQDPYAIVVSEIMLQQTQTYRVEQKFKDFIEKFSNFHELAQGSLIGVLEAWQGLGYNRRGRFLHQIAQKVVDEYDGMLPNSPDILVTFPGLGQATASSICAFAFNKPTVFIETNIRTVFIHHFFQDNINAISDKDLLPIVMAALDRDNPREWYYALMDYGVFLKKMVPNPSRRSSHYTKQSRFEGSDRQIRGAIVRLLVKDGLVSQEYLSTAFAGEDLLRVERIIEQLIREGLIARKAGYLHIS